MMKDLIRKVLKEETKKVSPSMIRAFYAFMEMELKGYNVYTDTPENRFDYEPESIWIINPETKEWIIDFRKTGELWYNYKIYNKFSNYFREGRLTFKKLLSIWVEDTFEKNVSEVISSSISPVSSVEDILKIGVQIK